jgi:integrase
MLRASAPSTGLFSRKKPYFVSVAPRIQLGYRRLRTSGTWTAKAGWTKVVGVADDYEPADGEAVLTFWQAAEKARAIARGRGDAPGRPLTVGEAVDAYELDRVARGRQPSNARNLRCHLADTPLAGKPLALASAAEFRRWRDALLAKALKPASVLRLFRGAKAAFNLAARLDARIYANRQAWTVGLAGIIEGYEPRDRILTDNQVRAFVREAYATDERVGLLVHVLAETGVRTSQALALKVVDLQAGALPSLSMPSSVKGHNRKRSYTIVPITAGLAARLRAAAEGRSSDEPLLMRGHGLPWSSASTWLRKRFREIAGRAGVDETVYGLRHASIVRSLLVGCPLRVVASRHDTSAHVIEKVYSRHIASYADERMRLGLIEVDASQAGDVIAIASRRR